MNNTQTLNNKQQKISLEPGVYENISFLDYLRIDALSHSELKKFKEQSPVHYKYKKENDIVDEKKAYNDGRIYHLSVLEIDQFKKRVIHEPNNWKDYERYLPDVEKKKLEKNPNLIFDKRVKANKIIMTIWEKSIEEKRKEDPYIITCPYQTYYNAKEIRKSVYNHNYCSRILKNSKTEVTLVWRDRETGIKCKGRLDIDNKDKSYIGDLKKTKSAKPYDFAYDARKYGYHSQMAFYTDGAHELGYKEIKAAIIIAVEDFPPFYCHPFYIKDDSEWMLKGREWYRNAIEELDYCETTGEWHGYYDKKNDNFNMFELPNIF